MLQTHLASLVLVSFAAAAALIDARTMRIPDALNAAFAASGFAASVALGHDLLASALGALAGFGALALIAALFAHFRGYEGLGMGDAKFLGAAGAWLGWMGLPFVILLASSLGLAWAGSLRLAGKSVSAGTEMPFGPFLALAASVVWLVQTYG